jgi:hypothetical protein
MQLSAPTRIVFLISLILVILALIGFFTPVAILTQYDFWFAVAAWVVLALGTLLTGF